MLIASPESCSRRQRPLHNAMLCILTESQPSHDLLGSLVHLVQKANKHRLLQPRLALVDLVDHLGDLVVRLLLVLGEPARNVNVLGRIDLLDFSLARGIPSAVVFLCSRRSVLPNLR
jgi:hypothetical protein